MTLNLGNYESAKVEVGMVADVNHDDDVVEVLSVLSAAVTEQLRSEFKTITEKQAKRES